MKRTALLLFIAAAVTMAAPGEREANAAEAAPRYDLEGFHQQLDDRATEEGRAERVALIGSCRIPETGRSRPGARERWRSALDDIRRP